MTQATCQDLISAVEQADSAAALVGAVRQLAAIQSEAAIPTLIQVLGYNNPGAAVAAVDGLVALGDRAVPYLMTEIDGYNYGARAWAIRALAMIGHPDALTILLETALGDFSLSVRRAAAKGLGSLVWDKLPTAEIPAAQEKALMALVTVATDPEWVVRYAAVVGLQSLLANSADLSLDVRQSTTGQLRTLAQTDDVLAVMARAQWALSAL